MVHRQGNTGQTVRNGRPGRRRATPAAVGGGGATMLAFGLLVGVHTNAATPVERAVVLASFDSVMIPNSPLDEELWWFGRSGSHRSESPEAPRLTYADAAVARPTS